MANLIFILTASIYLLIVGEGVCFSSVLTIAKSGSGSGTVTSNPKGISCGSDCTETYATAKKVTLTAKAVSDSYFTGWSGGGCSGTGTCSISMTSDLTVTANFEKKSPSISIFPDSLDFGQVEIGEKVSEVLKISNTGTGDLKVTVSGLEDTDFSVNTSSLTIKPQTNRNIKFTLTPTDTGVQKAAETAGLWPVPVEYDENSIESALQMGGQSVTGQATLSSNDKVNPETNVPLTALVVRPSKQCTLVIKHRIKYNEGPIYWQYSEDGTIPLTLSGYQLKKGQKLRFTVDCYNTDMKDAACGPDDTTKTTFTVTGSITGSNPKCPNCTISASQNPSNQYKITGYVNTLNQLAVKLQLTDTGNWNECCCSTCADMPSLAEYIFAPGNTFLLYVPFRPGGCYTKNVGAGGIPGYSGTMQWCVEF